MSVLFSPPAIIFINTDLVPQIQDVFTRQLYLTQIMDAATFDGYVAANPNYPLEIHQDGYRIMVLRDLWDMTNRQYADIVLFAKQGPVSVLVNHYGPPGITLPIDRVYMTALINLNKPPCPPFWCRPDLYDLFPGNPPEAYNRNYNPNVLDPPLNPEPADE